MTSHDKAEGKATTPQPIMSLGLLVEVQLQPFLTLGTTRM
jgi:hypothetical protein